MLTPSLSSNHANTLTHVSTLVRSPVGEANPERLHTPLKPVEALAAPDRQSLRSGSQEQSLASADKFGVTARDEAGAGSADASPEQAAQEKQERLKAKEQEQQEQDQQLIAQLAKRDREVRAHEQAHAAVGGQLAGSPSYQFERGPDGVSYAVGGEVPISTGEVAGDPEATLRNARIVQRAALAPGEPSAQDRKVAAEASRLEQQALQDILAQAQEQKQQQAAEAQAQRLAREEEQKRAEDQSTSDVSDPDTTEADEAQQSVTNRNIDINQRLIDIGVASITPRLGSRLNQFA